MVDELEALYRERLPDFTRAATAIAGDSESGNLVASWAPPG